ncbi:hypothetical protein L2E82_22438 [Cichorium intybus]|uniref:Uncharacterized protein n=1 Tax=Cichorium intybus TaxID=13427 RepID=A0ACB9DY16_CICIN|nr:hypothetical protein L2E82_22438 [Cichorium intybus]
MIAIMCNGRIENAIRDQIYDLKMDCVIGMALLRRPCLFSSPGTCGVILFSQLANLIRLLVVLEEYVVIRENLKSRPIEHDSGFDYLEKKPTKMTVVGFDLGNESCVVAVARQRGIDIVLNDESKSEMPALTGKFVSDSVEEQTEQEE